MINSVLSTGAAGFTAAQSLADTALKARSAALIAGLQHHALQNVHVQMGKLHVGLGFFTYLFLVLRLQWSASSTTTRIGNRRRVAGMLLRRKVQRSRQRGRPV
ncbi:hypothetical protein ACFS4T_21810 [Pseudomonas lini]